MKKKFINLYMDWAKRVAECSYAKRLQVGAVIVKDDCVISYGYNGMPSGWDNNCEDTEYTYDERDTVNGDWTYNNDSKQWSKLKTKPEVLHAESNAIAKLAKSNNSGVGSSIFITHSPCIECAKLIYQSGISTVYYDGDYRSDDGIKFLLRSGVEVVRTDKTII
jgi:dCMP deaminase